MNKAVVAIVDDRTQLDRVMAALQAEKFASQDISVLFPDKESSQTFAHDNSTKAPEGATAGTAGGAILGGALGWMVGLGALAIPGVGPFIAAGPIMAALAGATIGGAVGGITGALVGMGIPEYEAKVYEGFVKKGGILISVHTEESDRVPVAKRVFEAAGAHDISTSSLDSKPMSPNDKVNHAQKESNW